MSDSTKHLFLLDGMALVYRAHFAFIRNPVMTSDGKNASTLYGFTNTLLDILKKQKPTHLAVAFDNSAPTFRHKIFPEYKANRDAMPEDLAEAIPVVKKLIEGYKIPIIEQDGYEADDLIGTLSHLAEKDGFHVTMVTPDKDFAQLVTDKVSIYKPGMRGSDPEILDRNKILENWEITDPKQVADILGLWGDSSDNIPGIPGIGEKTAKKLMKQFGSMDAILDNTNQLKGKQKENLENFADQGRLSRELATIVLDAPIKPNWDDYVLDEPDEKLLTPIFQEWEFNSLAKRILGKDFEPTVNTKTTEASETTVTLKTIEDVDHDYHRYLDQKGRDRIIKLLKKSDRWCFDLETTDLDPLQTQIKGIAFSFKPHEAFYVELPASKKESKEILEQFREIFSTETSTKIGHNLKFDIGVLLAHGLEVNGPLIDTMILHALIESGQDQRHNMDYVSKTWLSYQPISFAEVQGEETQLDLLGSDGVNEEKFAEYACEDADVTYQLAGALQKELKNQNLENLYTTVEAPLIPVLADTENTGINIDQPSLQQAGVLFAKEIEQLENSIQEMAGTKFNLNSPKQLGKILFEDLKLEEKPKKTKTGQYVTNEQTLKSLANKHQIVADILTYRETAKLKSTYIDALPNHVSPVDQRVHTSFHQLMTATGRLASSNPNLQNIPVRTDKGKEIRKAFIPRDDNHVLVCADYSQIELRIMAYLCGDEKMIQDFVDDKDIHLATAARVHGVPEDFVTKQMRSHAKMVNFGIIYGISPFGLSQRLQIPRHEASELINEYFKQYPKIKEFIEKTINEARENEYVTTILGRKRFLRDINSRNATIRNRAERFAINTPIQGSAADMIKLAMHKTHTALIEKKLTSKIVLQVHDELVIDTSKKEQKETEKIVVTSMEKAMTLGEVPIKVDFSSGKNWLEAH